MKLVDFLNNEEKQEIIDRVKKEIVLINNIIQSVTNYVTSVS